MGTRIDAIMYIEIQLPLIIHYKPASLVYQYLARLCEVGRKLASFSLYPRLYALYTAVNANYHTLASPDSDKFINLPRGLWHDDIAGIKT